MRSIHAEPQSCGDKTGNDRWYDEYVPVADRLYDIHLQELESELKKERKMAKKFAELRAKMSPEAQARTAEKAKLMLAEMPLHELRQARGLTQKMLAEVLRVEQPSIAKMEKRADMYVSTLRSHVEAMGGSLVVMAQFPDGAVRISNFSDIGKAAAT